MTYDTTLLALALSLVGVFIIEGASRAIMRRVRRRVFTPDSRRLIMPDERISARIPACATSSYDNSGLRRAAQRARLTDADHCRVLLAGGSVIEGLFLDDRDSVGAQLERRLNEDAVDPDRPFEVKECARSGWRFHEVKRALDSVSGEPRWDLVIIHCGASDILRWAGLGLGALAESELHPPDDEIFAEFPVFKFHGLRGSGTAHVLRRLRSRLRRVTKEVGVGKRIVKLRTIRKGAEFLEEAAGFDSVLTYARDEARQCFRRAKMLSGSVVFVPQFYYFKDDYSESEYAMLWCGAIGDRLTFPPERFLSSVLIKRLLETLNTQVALVAAEENVKIINLGELVPRTEALFYDDFHLTAEGSQFFAAQLCSQIRAGAAFGHGSGA